MGAMTYTGSRFLLGAISLIPVALLFERRRSSPDERKYTLRYGIIVGLILFTSVTLQQYGIEVTRSSGKAGFITGLYIIFVPVIGLVFKKKPSVFVWAGVLLAFAGLYFLSVFENGFGNIGLGDLLLLLCSLGWTAHIIFVDKFSQKIRPLRFSMTQFAVCGILSAIGALAFEKIEVSQFQIGYMTILYGGILSVGVAYTLQIVGQRNLPPAKCAVIFSLESLFAALGGVLIGGESMSKWEYLGCALIFAGIIISQFQRRSGKVNTTSQ